MNQDKEWIKKEIAKILVTEGLMNEAFGQGGRHSDLWNTFVSPFTDVVPEFCTMTTIVDMICMILFNIWQYFIFYF